MPSDKPIFFNPETEVFSLVAGETLRTGDMVKVRPDGKVYRARQDDQGYDFISFHYWEENDVAQFPVRHGSP